LPLNFFIYNFISAFLVEEKKTIISELPYCDAFWNVNLSNEDYFANFAQNWLPWQITSLEEPEKKVQIDHLQ